MNTTNSLTLHRPALRGFVLRLTGDEALAEDICQEAFVRAEKTGGGPRDASAAKAWLHAVALNLVRDHFRAKARRPEVSDGAALLETLPSDAPGPEDALLESEMSACIGEFLARLPEAQYQVVAMHDLGGVSHKEIAEELGMSEANARVVLHRGRTALREIMKAGCALSFDDRLPCERK